MTEAARYLRQVLLPEIGPEGQARIKRSIARSAKGPTLAHEVAELYARGAGFSDVAPGPIDDAALAPLEIIQNPAARSVCAGARAALAAMREAIGMDSSEGRAGEPEGAAS